MVVKRVTNALKFGSKMKTKYSEILSTLSAKIIVDMLKEANVDKNGQKFVNNESGRC